MIPYHLVPAGASFDEIRNLGIYIKYKRGPSQIHFKTLSPKLIHAQLPDRELFIISGPYDAANLPFSFDEYTALDLFNGATSTGLTKSTHAVKEIMLNFVEASGKANKDGKTRLGDSGENPSGVRLISDSGGFQISRDRVDLINPYHLIKFYNENVDSGMVLDLPFFTNDPKVIEMSIEAQVRNTDIMIREKRESLELINVVQGINTEVRKYFHDAVYRPEIRRVAAGLTYIETQLSSMASFLTLADHTKGLYDSYHSLGVASILQVVPYIRAASLGLAPYITSDSTTHLQAAVNREYIFFPFVMGPYKRIHLKSAKYAASLAAVLPCQCPVCSALKYTDFLATLDNSMGKALLSMHNLFASMNYVANMKQVMMDNGSPVPLAEVKRILTAQFASRSSSALKEFFSCLDMVDMMANDGITKAQKKFGFYLKPLSSNVGPRSLFVEKGAEEISARAEWERNRFQTLLANFATCWAGDTERKMEKNKGESIFNANTALKAGKVHLSVSSKTPKRKKSIKQKVDPHAKHQPDSKEHPA